MKAKKSQFNLIEILISMVVIIFAMFIIISFIPLANQQQGQAINQTHLANIARNMVTYIKSQPQDVIYANDNTRYSMIQSFPLSKYNADTDRSDYNTSSPIDQNGAIRIYAHSSEDSTFLIRSISTVAGQEVKEAELEARVYRQNASFHYSTGLAQNGGSPAANTAHVSGQNYASLNLGSTSLSPSSAKSLEQNNLTLSTETTRVMIEFSWPLNRDYEDRQTEFIFFDQQLTTKK